MVRLPLFLITLHVTANLVWIGSIMTVGWLVQAASRSTSGSRSPANAPPDASSATAFLARSIYLRVAVPAFLASLVFGMARLLQDPATYMHLHWFHAKLTAVSGIVALHHILGRKAKQLSTGSMQSARSGAILCGALLACAFLSVTFVVFKSELIR